MQLKNSGIAGSDVKVTYLTDNGTEWVIKSSAEFQRALCAFRLKARLEEMIHLRLGKVSSSSSTPVMSRKHSNDVETQFDPEVVSKAWVSPPDWFTNYMKMVSLSI